MSRSASRSATERPAAPPAVLRMPPPLLLPPPPPLRAGLLTLHAGPREEQALCVLVGLMQQLRRIQAFTTWAGGLVGALVGQGRLHIMLHCMHRFCTAAPKCCLLPRLLHPRVAEPQHRPRIAPRFCCWRFCCWCSRTSNLRGRRFCSAPCQGPDHRSVGAHLMPPPKRSLRMPPPPPSLLSLAGASPSWPEMSPMA